MSWGPGVVCWRNGSTYCFSVVFSWQVPGVLQEVEFLRQAGKDVLIGGPAIRPTMHLPDVVRMHNDQATFTSRGCIRKCPFCLVPKAEGALRELDSWPIRPIVCDGNILATSRRHFDRVVDSLKPLRDVEFNGGLDVRLLKEYHAERLCELRIRKVWIAWDNIEIESLWRNAVSLLRRKGFPKAAITTYVLIGFRDTPEDALYRLTEITKLGLLPFPMRYQPIDCLSKNSYVGHGWTSQELARYMKYWSRLRFLRAVPFEEFRLSKGRRTIGPISRDLAEEAP